MLMKCVPGLLAIGTVAAASQAQVTILTVDRSVGATACVYAPPTYPDWCESDGRSNFFAGSWVDVVSFGNSAAGGVGFAGSITVSNQSSDVQSNQFFIAGSARVEVDSDGECSSTGDVLTSFDVKFKVVSPCRAVLSGETQIDAGGELRIQLRNGEGTLMYTFAGNYEASFDLAPGNYEYFASGLADGTCSGTCSHKERIDWQSRIDFVPLACPADFNGDNVVDDADFVVFVAAYNELVCPEEPAPCPVDLNGDGIVEDSDFVIFAAAYNELLCP